eukprot:239309-Pyramimonas_sp.AAC.1
MLQSQAWSGDPEVPLVSSFPPLPPKLTITSHEIWHSQKVAVWRCRVCGRFARSLTSLNAMLTQRATRDCIASPVQLLAASEWWKTHAYDQGFALMRSEA